MSLNRRQILFASALGVAAVATITATSACGGGGSSPPTGKVIFLHDASDLGNVEVLFDGEIITTAKPAELGKPTQVRLGNHTVGLRNPGASSTLLEESFNFQQQTYLLAFNGASADGTLAFWIVDQTPPSLADDEVAVEVVSLYDGQFSFDVYADGVLLAESIALRTASDFVSVGSGPVDIQIHNAGDDPTTAAPVHTETLTFRAGGAFMILMQNPAEGESGVVTLEVIDVR